MRCFVSEREAQKRRAVLILCVLLALIARKIRKTQKYTRAPNFKWANTELEPDLLKSIHLSYKIPGSRKFQYFEFYNAVKSIW